MSEENMYVKDVIVNYGEGNCKDCLIEDVNKGCGGDFVWLRPVYTFNENEAAGCFLFSRSKTAVPHMCDLAKGAGGEFRYIRPVPVHDKKIRSVFLSENETGDGFTTNLNEGREGRSLYLCWYYA